MTTPERLRRRQRIEGLILIAIGVFSLLQFNYFHGQDDKQRACLADVVREQNEVLTLRGDLSKQDSDINADESAATRTLIVKVFAATDSEGARAAFAEAQHKWADIDARRDEVTAARRANPIPDLPAGTCEG